MQHIPLTLWALVVVSAVLRIDAGLYVAAALVWLIAIPQAMLILSESFLQRAAAMPARQYGFLIRAVSVCAHASSSALLALAGFPATAAALATSTLIAVWAGERISQLRGE